jgi:hypothetical protein
MTRAEYEQKKLELEATRRLALQFLQRGYEAQLLALENAWAWGAETSPEPPVHRQEETPEPAAEAAPVQHPPWAYLEGGLLESVRSAVEQLPPEFKKDDIVRLLAAKPERSSLHRAMDTLMREGMIQIHIRGGGRVPNIYRKVK